MIIIITLCYYKWYWLLFIKAPWIVSVGYRILRPLVNEKTANKVVIYSHDQEEWKKALLEEIDADQLPACYGGTMTDPDGNPNCVTKVINIHEISYLIKQF